METYKGCGSDYIKSLIVENPSDSENIGFLLPFDRNIRIKKVAAVLPGGASTPSVTYSLRHDGDRSAAGTEVNVGGKVVTSTTTGDTVTTFNNPIVLANTYLWLTTTAKSGTVPQLEVYLHYELF